MRIAGIVAEYNPFHNGHAYLIDKTKELRGGCEATHLVAVMSGSFVQRGEPAILSKFDRAKSALAGGVDLVIELPAPWCLSSAEGFAFGAVSLLSSLGCVDAISFGTESGDLSTLEKAVTLMETPRYSSLLKYYMGLGSSFPESQQKALAEIAGKAFADLLDTPNNTLAVEYLKALHRLNSTITPFTVKRYGAAHDNMMPLGDTASASYLRSLFCSDRLINALPYMPAGCATVVSYAAQNGRLPATAENLERAVLAKLRTLTLEEICNLPGISEGLENRFYKAIGQAASLTDLESLIKTKRYPLTRVRRLIWSAFLGIPAGYANKTPPYLRVLASNEKGKEIVAAAKNASLPWVYRASQVQKLNEEAQTVWNLECKATNLHQLAFPTPLPCGMDYTSGVIRE